MTSQVREATKPQMPRPTEETPRSVPSQALVATMKKPYVCAWVVYYPPVPIGQKLRGWPAVVGHVHQDNRVDMAALDIYTGQWSPILNYGRKSLADAGIAYSAEPQADTWSWPKEV